MTTVRKTSRMSVLKKLIIILLLFYNIMMQQSDKIQRGQDKIILHPENHKHTLIWIHGLAQRNEEYMNKMIQALGQNIQNVKIVLPQAPQRYVTASKRHRASWFDIKFRSQKSFIVPFDEAFSSEQVNESFEKILKPIIEQQSKLIKDKNGKLVVCGFSQGSGMALHCLFNLPHLVFATVAISGYFFPITKFDPKLQNYVRIIYGLQDNLRPWQYAKTTYYGRIGPQKMFLIPGMKHQFNKDALSEFKNQLSIIFNEQNPKL